MIRALRRSRLLLVTAVVALLCAMPMAALPLLHGGDHADCDPQAVHDSSAHHLSQGSAEHADQRHCMVCHWSQWVRAIQEDAPAVTPSDGGDLVAALCAAQPRTISAFRSFARPPPLT